MPLGGVGTPGNWWVNTPHGVEGLRRGDKGESEWGFGHAFGVEGMGGEGWTTIRFGTPYGVETMWTSSVQLELRL